MPRRYCDASTIRVEAVAVRALRHRRGLMPSAAAMSFLVRFINSAFTIRIERSSRDPTRWSRHISAALIASTSARVPSPARNDVRTNARPGWRCADAVHSIASRARPPAGPVLDTGGLIQHGDRAPADAEPHIDLGCDGQTQRQRRIYRQADRRKRALEFVADCERGRVDRVIGNAAKGAVHQAGVPQRDQRLSVNRRRRR